MIHIAKISPIPSFQDYCHDFFQPSWHAFVMMKEAQLVTVLNMHKCIHHVCVCVCICAIVTNNFCPAADSDCCLFLCVHVTIAVCPLQAPFININAVDDSGMTALMWAAFHNSLEVVQELLQRDAGMRLIVSYLVCVHVSVCMCVCVCMHASVSFHTCSTCH